MLACLLESTAYSTQHPQSSATSYQIAVPSSQTISHKLSTELYVMRTGENEMRR